MFLIEPLIWMFKVENFGKHLLNHVITFLCSWIVLGLLLIIFSYFFTNLTPEFEIAKNVILFLIMMIPWLSLAGYFWCLTDNIINREQLPVANSIYNGRVKLIDKITLPEWDSMRFIWRGIASIVTTIIMYIPIVMIICTILHNLDSVLTFWNIPHEYGYKIFVGLTIFLLFFVPALLWNYAKRDSVVAVLNFPKAVYIVETYTGTYILNTLLFAFFSFIHSHILKFVLFVLGLVAYVTPRSITFAADANLVVHIVLFAIISYLIEIVFVYINAYLLGTFAPPSEGD